MGIMVAVFALFIVIGVTAGLVFNTVTIALPKVVDERIGNSISLVAVGGIATAVFLCGAIAQFTVGRVVEKYPAHLVFAFTGLMQFVGVIWVAYATGTVLLAALAFAMAFIYAQVTVNDFVIARYTADAWRGRVYAVRYFITYLISGAAISMICAPARPRRLRSRADGDGGDRARLPVRHGGALRFSSTASSATCGRRSRRNSRVQNRAGTRSTTSAPVRSLTISAMRLRWQQSLSRSKQSRHTGWPDFTIEISSSIASIASGVFRCLA